jgi:hypothetical protein
VPFQWKLDEFVSAVSYVAVSTKIIKGLTGQLSGS